MEARESTQQPLEGEKVNIRPLMSSGRVTLLAPMCCAVFLALFSYWFSGVAQGSATLPDNRAYEQVSPVDKNGTDVLPDHGVAAIDGNRVAFSSKGSFAGQPTALAVEGSPYLATRGPSGWTTEGIALPNGHLAFGNAYVGFTPSLSKGIVYWWEGTRFGPYDPAAQHNFNQYIRDNDTGSFQLINGTLSSMANDEGFIWGSSDLSMVGIDTSFPLTLDSPCKTADHNHHCAYESEDGMVRLASILPNGEPTEGSIGNIPFLCNFEHSVSDDGLRLFFTTLNDQGKIYVRENHVSTSLVSGSERTLPGGVSGSKANYQSAEAAHGNRLLFTTLNSLVDEDTNSTNDLYLYDFTQPAGERLTLVSADQNPGAPDGAEVDGGQQGCAGLVAVSEDLRRVYFVARQQIVEGAPEGPGPKLYLWDDTGTSPQLGYVATLDPEDVSVWLAPDTHIRRPDWRNARWSRDGRYLAFLSVAALTSDDQNGEGDIYRFDAESGSLDCLTCSSDALPAKGKVAFQPPATWPINHPPENVLNNGKVYFQTTRGLVAADSNGQGDVYEYSAGQIHLISRGSGPYASTFFDATPSGSDVFFLTRDRLVGWDKDASRDVYDARVGGGFPEPGFVPPPCEGEACLAPPDIPNDATPGSSSFNGAGNVSPPKIRRCPAGKVRRHGRCRKRKHARQRRNRASDATTRSHG